MNNVDLNVAKEVAQPSQTRHLWCFSTFHAWKLLSCTYHGCNLWWYTATACTACMHEPWLIHAYRGEMMHAWIMMLPACILGSNYFMCKFIIFIDTNCLLLVERGVVPPLMSLTKREEPAEVIHHYQFITVYLQLYTILCSSLESFIILPWVHFGIFQYQVWTPSDIQ